MKRVIGALVATIAGVLWVVTYRVTPHSRPVAATSPTASPAASTSPSASGAPSASPSPSPRGPSGSFTGSDVPTMYGDVQVRAVLTNGKVTNVVAVQMPYDRARSAEISQIAGPMLRQEAVQAQSARIDIISGATYTSVAYAQSLSDALKQAKG